MGQLCSHSPYPLLIFNLLTVYLHFYYYYLFLNFFLPVTPILHFALWLTTKTINESKRGFIYILAEGTVR